MFSIFTFLFKTKPKIIPEFVWDHWITGLLVNGSIILKKNYYYLKKKAKYKNAIMHLSVRKYICIFKYIVLTCRGLVIIAPEEDKNILSSIQNDSYKTFFIFKLIKTFDIVFVFKYWWLIFWFWWCCNLDLGSWTWIASKEAWIIVYERFIEEEEFLGWRVWICSSSLYYVYRGQSHSSRISKMDDW